MAQPEQERRSALRLVLAFAAVLVVAAGALAVVLLDRGDGDGDMVVADAEPPPAAATDATVAPPEPTAPSEPCPTPTGDLPAPTTTAYDQPPAVDLGAATTVEVTLRTTCGDIVLELDAAGAPDTAANFVGLAEDGYYDGVGFHRVVDDFLIQGGDPTGTGTGCLDSACTTQLPGYAFADELGPAEQVVADTGGYPRGTLAMANKGPDTNGSQFFIVQAARGHPLSPDYAVFGMVVSGMDVVDRIALGPVDGDRALDPVVIRSVDVER